MSHADAEPSTDQVKDTRRINMARRLLFDCAIVGGWRWKTRMWRGSYPNSIAGKYRLTSDVGRLHKTKGSLSDPESRLPELYLKAHD
jgi:hypothetical protein